jgi:ATP-dependent DNA helicase RecQ
MDKIHIKNNEMLCRLILTAFIINYRKGISMTPKNKKTPEHDISFNMVLAEDPVQETARTRFGIPYLYPYQHLVVANILDRVDQIVILPTGGGKSLCFQLPSLLLPGVTLVIMPLLALIADQERSLASRGIKASVLKGGQSKDERDELFGACIRGETKIILSTPEAALSDKALAGLKNITLTHLVIDEAHCVSEWGESFRPSYLDLHRLHEELAIETVSAFTATASSHVIEKIKGLLFRERTPSAVLANPDRPNLYYRVVPTISKNRTLETIVCEKAKPLIVFCRSRKGSERIARLLDRRLQGRLRALLPGTEVKFYHAGLLSSERKETEAWFMSSRNGILVSTCAYGLGIDKQNVRTIVHVDIPPSVEAYLQESGRAGRDGSKAEVVLMYSNEDLQFGAAIQDDVAKKRYARITDYAVTKNRCRRDHILSLLDYKLSEACSGCDTCDADIVVEPAGKTEILSFIEKNKRRYTLRDIKQILKGDSTYDTAIKGLHRVSGFGMLYEWDSDDIEDAIKRLIIEGTIEIPNKGFWKKRVTIGRNKPRSVSILSDMTVT